MSFIENKRDMAIGMIVGAMILAAGGAVFTGMRLLDGVQIGTSGWTVVFWVLVAFLIAAFVVLFWLARDATNPQTKRK